MFQVVYSALVSHGRKFRLPLAVVFCPFLYSGNKNNLRLHQHSAKSEVTATKKVGACALLSFMLSLLLASLPQPPSASVTAGRRARVAYAVVAVGGFGLASYVRIAPKFG